MKRYLRRPRVLFVAAAGLMLTALFLLFITTPSPTILSVQVVDAETGEPLPGALVRVRSSSGPPLPTATTDSTGVARFEGLPPDPAYLIRIQKVDYDILFEPGVAVPEGEETEISVWIPPNTASRLFVGLDGARVAEVDTASLLVVQTFSLPDEQQGATRHVGIHPSSDLLYAVAGNRGCILERQSGTSQGCFEVEGIVETLSADASHLYVVTWPEGVAPTSNTDDSPVSVSSYDQPGQLLNLDAHTGELLSREEIYPPLWSPRLIWRPGGQRVYFIDPADWSLWVLAASADEVLPRVSSGAYPQEGFRSADGHYRYTWSEDSFENLQATFQGNLTPVFTNHLPLINISAFSLAPAGQELYLLDVQLGTLSILDPTGKEPPVLVAVGKRPVALALSPGGMWAYVANRDSRTISVIHLPSVTVVQSISLDGEPLSLAIR